MSWGLCACRMVNAVSVLVKPPFCLFSVKILSAKMSSREVTIWSKNSNGFFGKFLGHFQVTFWRSYFEQKLLLICLDTWDATWLRLINLRLLLSGTLDNLQKCNRCDERIQTKRFCSLTQVTIYFVIFIITTSGNFYQETLHQIVWIKYQKQKYFIWFESC